MKKKSFLFITAIVFIVVTFISCTQPVDPEQIPGQDDQEQQEPEKLEALTGTVLVTDNWVWDSKPAIVIEVSNPNKVDVTEVVSVTITTDLKKAVTTVEQSVEVPASGTKKVTISTEEDLEPGFYKA